MRRVHDEGVVRSKGRCRLLAALFATAAPQNASSYGIAGRRMGSLGRNAKNLAETFGELDMARNTVRRIPSETHVQGWIDQAKALPRIVEY